ncbi:NAD(P)/FAD-dependent oxidoreductase [Streptomyces sp. NPDC007088]|uniref:NAD(P)/FAD-dependent oxidoreductase n=1 Tax=Streptomyces sp. NPDC007088 TaxID=3364773 RepID=UPI0036C28EFF
MPLHSATTPEDAVPLPVHTPQVLVIGAGPAGLTAAARLARRLPGEVLVLDREHRPGGIPRHSDHTGYGLRDLRRVLRGPAYARLLADRATAAGAVLRTATTVTGWAGPRTVEITGPQGRARVTADAVVLATGARERPRSARLVPGDRPHGVLTTGQLQNLVHLHHQPVGERAVVVGAELVSYSAALTLREAGCRTALMVSSHPRPESYGVFNLAGRTVLNLPVARRAKVSRVIGKGRVEAVELTHLDTGARTRVACDTVVFTGDWIPDHELARLAGLTMDPASRAPLVDTALRTSAPGVFAAGNLLHPVDTADIAALDGAHVADRVEEWLRTGAGAPEGDGVRLLAEAPLRWIAPGLLRPGDPAPPRKRLSLWTDTFVATPKVTARQDGRVLNRRTLPWPAAPGRVFRLPWSLVAGARPDAGPVTVGLD